MASRQPDPDRRLRLWADVLCVARGPAGGDCALVSAVCTVARETLGVDGAAIVQRADASFGPDIVAASGRLTVTADELQYTVGEGPSLSALAENRRQLISRVGVTAPRWPGFAALAAEAGVAALFSFPLAPSGSTTATLDLLRTRPGSFTGEQLADAVALARLAELSLLADRDRIRAREGPGHYAPVGVATVLLAAHLGLPAADASARLRAHAFVRQRSPLGVAHDVIIGRLRLDRS